MIAINELRIGNLFRDKYGLIISCPVCTIDFIENKVNGLSVDKIHPIKLTNELLENYGFKKQRHWNSTYYGTYDWLKNFRFKEGMSDGYFYKENFILDSFVSKNGYYLTHDNLQCDSVLIEYVHQLQNLYFSITGNELTIK